MPPIRVLVVDDSVVVRKMLCDILGSIPNVEVAGTAPKGSIALAKIPQLNPDVVTLDIEMPLLDGLATLVELRKLYPRLPVLMCSTLTDRGASATLEALARGASDYITKPSNSESLAASSEQMRQELEAKILAFVHAGAAVAPPRVAPLKRARGVPQRIDIPAVGASTGGPNALADMITGLPEDFPVPVVLVQHMPPLFTRLLAQRLNARSPLAIAESEAGTRLEPGHVWIAPGKYHMTVARVGNEVILELNQDPPENSCRPGGGRTIPLRGGDLWHARAGGGDDGHGLGRHARGQKHSRGGRGDPGAGDEATSVVWGMPGSIVSLGLADQVHPLDQIAPEILRRVRYLRSSAMGRPGVTRILPGREMRS